MKKRGISLIVLVITIIVIVILGTAVVVTFVKNNPIENAKNATNKWNKKTLEEKANMLETELLLEFQEAGLGSMVLPSYAKEVYMDALKEGKTEEEAKQIAMDSFIGDPTIWKKVNNRIVRPTNEAFEYDPIYEEVLRVLYLIEDSGDEYVELNIDNTIVPDDLVENLKKYQEVTLAYYSGEISSSDYDTQIANIEPLIGLVFEYNPDNKYYYLLHTTLRVPYYFYLDEEKTQIAKLDDYIVQTSQVADVPDEKINVIIEEGYTTFSGKGVPNSMKGELILPNTLKRIEKYAFRIISPTKLVIPSSVEYISEDAFYQFFGSQAPIKEIVIKKEKGSIPGEPWGLDPAQTTIKWEP